MTPTAATTCPIAESISQFMMKFRAQRELESFLESQVQAVSSEPQTKVRDCGMPLVQSVHFNERVACGITIAPHNRSVAAWRERPRDRGFKIVCRRQAGAGDAVFLRIFPVVVKNK